MTKGCFSVIFIISVAVVAILANFAAFTSADKFDFQGSYNQLVSDTLRTQCSSTCFCQNSANPFHEFQGTVETAGVDRDVTDDVFTLCHNKSPLCLSGDVEFCRLNHSYVSSIQSVSYLRSWEIFRRAPIRAVCLSRKNISCVEGEVFNELSFVNVLSMDHNYISNLSWVKNLQNISLIYLDLSFNFLQFLKRNAFQEGRSIVW